MSDPRFYDLNGPFTLAELISGLDIDPPDTPFLDETIHSVSDLSRSAPGQISFLTSKKYKSDIETAKATACLVTAPVAGLVGDAHIVPLVSKSPRAHFGRIVNKFVQKKSLNVSGEDAYIAPSANIHPTALVGAGASVGERVQIGPYSVVGAGVVIGDDTFIDSHVLLECALIGTQGHIKSGARIGTDGFGMDVDEKGALALPHIGRVLIGDRVHIGANTTIDRGFLHDTEIADDVKIDNLVQIAHNVKIGSGTMIAGRVGISGSCVVGSNVRMGGAVGLADHLNIGDNVQIAAAAGVMHNIPDGEVWSGIPAMPIRDHMRLISATRKLGQKKKT